MLLNIFFKLYDLNGDDCTENNFHIFWLNGLSFGEKWEPISLQNSASFRVLQ